MPGLKVSGQINQTAKQVMRNQQLATRLNRELMRSRFINKSREVFLDKVRQVIFWHLCCALVWQLAAWARLWTLIHQTTFSWCRVMCWHVQTCERICWYVAMHLVENYANWFELFVLMNSLPPCLEIQFIERSWLYLLSPCRCPCGALGLRPSWEVGGSCIPFVTMRTLEQKQKQLTIW